MKVKPLPFLLIGQNNHHFFTTQSYLLIKCKPCTRNCMTQDGALSHFVCCHSESEPYNWPVMHHSWTPPFSCRSRRHTPLIDRKPSLWRNVERLGLIHLPSESPTGGGNIPIKTPAQKITNQSAEWNQPSTENIYGSYILWNHITKSLSYGI